MATGSASHDRHSCRAVGSCAGRRRTSSDRLLAGAFFFKAGDEFSRGFIGLWVVGGAVGLVAARVVVSRIIRQWTAEGRLDRRAVVVGGGESAAVLIRALENSDSAHIRIVG